MQNTQFCKAFMKHTSLDCNHVCGIVLDLMHLTDLARFALRSDDFLRPQVIDHHVSAQTNPTPTEPDHLALVA